MLLKISDNIYLNIQDIYLIDYEEYSEELLIYINQHPKHPIILKNEDDIELFKANLEAYQHEQILSKRCHAENEQKTGQDFLEFPNMGAEATI